MLAQGSPAGLALAIDELRRDDTEEREDLPGLGLGEEPDAVAGIDASWRFHYPRHIQMVEAEVVEAIARGNERLKKGEWDGPEILLIELPPRHGKSTLISEHTPAWFLGTFPDRQVILCSCESDFAQTWGAKARDILEEFGPSLYGVEVSQKSHAAKRWNIEGRRGAMVTAGVGARITGSGSHLMIIDDPTKNAEEAMSEVIRKKHEDWWLTTARTRIEPGGVVVILMTRWHEGDLGGLVKKLGANDGGDRVTEIRLPALAEKNDPLGRKPGEALWPDRYTAQALENTKKTIGAYWFSAMYQGSPTPDEGGIFNRRYFRYFKIEKGQVILDTLNGPVEYPVSSCVKVSYVDLAAGEKQTSDYTVLTEAWVTPGRDLLIRNVTRDRIPGPDQPAFFRDHYVGKLKVEQIGYQTALIRTLLREGLPVEPVYPDKDKVTRASAAGALYRGGKIFHMAGAEYLAEFEAELLAFPAGEHDDQVDTVAYAARDLATVPLTGGRTKRVEKQETVTGGLLGADM